MLSNVSLIRRIKLKNFSTNAKTKHFCLCAHKISFKQFTTNQPIRIHCNESEKISIYFFLYFVLNESLFFDEFNYIERQKPNYFTLNEKINKYGYCTWTRSHLQFRNSLWSAGEQKICKYFIKNRFIMNWLYFSWIHLQLNKSIAYCIRHRI